MSRSKEGVGMEENSQRGRRRILVVEAEESIRNIVSIFLSERGYEVITARSGEEGVSLLLKGSFDLVLSDLTMPGMDGWTLACYVKNRSPATPVGLMTGWGAKETIDKMKGSAVDFAIFKPFGLNDLQEAVARVLDAKPFCSPTPVV